MRICQAVQGMPLALELAAVWVGKLSLAEIAEEIARSADFLSTTMRNLPERLRSVRAVFETTWRRLTDEERQVFRRLSVFRGGFTREAAAVVAEADLTTLAALIDKALLWREPKADVIKSTNCCASMPPNSWKRQVRRMPPGTLIRITTGGWRSIGQRR